MEYLVGFILFSVIGLFVLPMPKIKTIRKGRFSGWLTPDIQKPSNRTPYMQKGNQDWEVSSRTLTQLADENSAFESVSLEGVDDVVDDPDEEEHFEDTPQTMSQLVEERYDHLKENATQVDSLDEARVNEKSVLKQALMSKVILDKPRAFEED